jgi:hypothetical protein
MSNVALWPENLIQTPPADFTRHRARIANNCNDPIGKEMPVLRLSPFSLCLFPVLLCSCASIIPQYDIPVDPSSGSPTVASIVDRVTCELANLVAPGASNEVELLTGQYEVAVQLDLTVNDTGGLTPTVTYTNGPFSFGASAKLERSREQFFSEKLYYSLLDLREEVEENDRAFKAGETLKRLTDCAGPADTNLAGDLGLRQAVDLALGSNYLQTTAKMSDQGAFGGYVNFLITKNVNGVGPTWTLTHFTGPGGLGALSEVNTDKLTFAFAISEHPLTAEQLAKRRLKGRSRRSVASGRTQRQHNARAEQLLQQMQVNQISNRLNTIRGFQ